MQTWIQFFYSFVGSTDTVTRYAVFLAALMILPHAIAADDFSFRKSMVLAKFVGMCETVNDLKDFQSKHRLSGGDKFISEFTNSILGDGVTAQSLLQACDEAIPAYKKMSEMADFVLRVKPTP